MKLLDARLDDHAREQGQRPRGGQQRQALPDRPAGEWQPRAHPDDRQGGADQDEDHGDHRRHPADPNGEGRGVQRRDRDHVADGRDGRHRDAVEVPLVGVRGQRQDDGQRADDHARHRSAENGDHDDVDHADALGCPARRQRPCATTRARPTRRTSARRRRTRSGTGRLRDDACARTCRCGCSFPDRDESAPKMLPRIEFAAGSRTRSPGSFSSVPVIAPRATPAAISPTVENDKRDQAVPDRAPLGPPVAEDATDCREAIRQSHPSRPFSLAHCVRLRSQDALRRGCPGPHLAAYLGPRSARTVRRRSARMRARRDRHRAGGSSGNAVGGG